MRSTACNVSGGGRELTSSASALSGHRCLIQELLCPRLYLPGVSAAHYHYVKSTDVVKDYRLPVNIKIFTGYKLIETKVSWN